MKTPRILVAVCSAAKYDARRRACRETWIAGLPENTGHFFFVGETPHAIAEPDVVVLPHTPDDYANLTRKVASMLRYAATREDFDYLFKCDDDTYVVGERLPAIVPDTEAAVGYVWHNAEQSMSGGAGYLLPRARLAAIAEAMSVEGFYEDVEVSLAVRSLGIPVIHSHRLQPAQTALPSWKNDKVTAHWCKPEDMRAIFSAYAMSAEEKRRADRKKNAAEILAALRPDFEIVLRHAHWNDRVRFYSNGLFSRTGTTCRGEWKKDAEDNITLAWFDWSPETIRPIPGTPGLYAFS